MNNITPTRDASPTNTNDVDTHGQPSTPNRFINVVSQSQGSGGIDALIEATVRTSNDVFSPMVQRQIGPMEVSALLYDDNLDSHKLLANGNGRSPLVAEAIQRLRDQQK